jgi:hypothetical protein
MKIKIVKKIIYSSVVFLDICKSGISYFHTTDVLETFSAAIVTTKSFYAPIQINVTTSRDM